MMYAEDLSCAGVVLWAAWAGAGEVGIRAFPYLEYFRGPGGKAGALGGLGWGGWGRDSHFSLPRARKYI